MIELVIGSRGSELALWQARFVAGELERAWPEARCSIRVIKTTGDKIADVPLARIGSKGLFVKEIELALVAGEIDLAVHSAKDLPSEMDERLCIAAYPEREDPSDALVSKRGKLNELPAGSVVGTSSVRRRAQVLRARPDLEIADLRGNLDTRLRKLDSGGYDAVVLAGAGLRRMGWAGRITETLPFEVCLPAAGQGALAVQCRVGDRAAEMAAVLDHAETRRCVSAERVLLGRLQAGCQTPVAVLARESEGRTRIDAAVISLDGSKIIRMDESGDAADAGIVGERLAERLLGSPANELLEEARLGAEQQGMGAA